jgi:hypothetical protein
VTVAFAAERYAQRRAIWQRGPKGWADNRLESGRIHAMPIHTAITGREMGTTRSREGNSRRRGDGRGNGQKPKYPNLLIYVKLTERRHRLKCQGERPGRLLESTGMRALARTQERPSGRPGRGYSSHREILQKAAIFGKERDTLVVGKPNGANPLKLETTTESTRFAQ